MRILKTIAALRSWREEQRAQHKSVGLVPTMGALHAGHLSLVQAAVQGCSSIVVSIFVNPTQFGPGEDFERYPRTFEADNALLQAEAGRSYFKQIAIFAPSVAEIYPRGANTFVEVPEFDARLDGGSRPGHFRGVATVVAKLLIACGADRAYFGQKDAGQCALIRRMATDLLIPTEIVVCPIVREADGLAMSSRNRYLSAAERKQALVLGRALRGAQEMFGAGEHDAKKLREAAVKVFASEPAVRVDFVEIVEWSTLKPVARAESGTLCAVAAYVGKTRLIDNIIF